MARYPNSLLIEIGRIATTWASIEQEIILHASALAAQDTGGRPIEYLRFDFKRLRETWYKLCKKNHTQEDVNKVFHPINSRLSALSTIRGYVIHGGWIVLGRGKFRVESWEQTDALRRERIDFSLAELRTMNEELLSILKAIYDYHDRQAASLGK